MKAEISGEVKDQMKKQGDATKEQLNQQEELARGVQSAQRRQRARRASGIHNAA